MRIKILLIALFLFEVSFTYSQTIFSSSNLSAIKVSTLSDQDIQKVKLEMTKRNLSFSEVENMAMAKGMSATEIGVLKQRLQQIGEQNTSSIGISPATTASYVPADTIIVTTPIHVVLSDSTIFGSDLFSNPALSFEPNMNLATPANYILGPMDELQIVISGVQQYSEKVRINKEGVVTLTNIGQLHLAGQTFSAAELLIRKLAGKIYSTLQSGGSEMSISLTNIRTINVTIIGAQTPGNYSLSSLSTVFNALHISGGPNNNGSYRKIELIRNNKVIRVIDIYKFLMTGDQTDNINLQDNDVVSIPVYQKRIQIKGKVKRTGIFELKDSETFNDLLKYSSGFNESAFKSSVKLVQNTEKEFKIIDLYQKEYSSYIPKSGDIFTVSEILNRFENRVTIRGAVFRPDVYALKDGMTIKDLIASADGLTEDAYWDHALLKREGEDRMGQVIGIDLNLVMNGNLAANLILKKEDELMISSKFDFLEKFTVNINGEIQKAGQYNYIPNLSLYDLIVQAGGFKESASKKIEIARMIKSDTVSTNSVASSEIINVELSGNIRDQAKNFILQPNDIIQVRKKPTYEKNLPVFISGEIIYPGEYILSRKDERIIDIIERAGGFNSQANSNGVKVIRILDNIQTVGKEEMDVTIPIDYERIKRNPRSRKNIRMQAGDKIIIAKKSNVVKVVGQVALNSEIPIRSTRGVRFYINSVGGVTDSANTKKIYVVYANRSAKRTRNYVFFKDYPKVERGSQIVVPKKSAKTDRMGTSEIVAVAGILSSMTGMTLLIYRLFKP
jgi:protein involved in polysaccharide export with SLBB domain